MVQQQKNINPTEEEIKELQNIRNLLICSDKESIKLGKACFFKSVYYNRIKNKNLRFYSRGFFTVDPYRIINKKISLGELIGIIDYILGTKYKDIWHRKEITGSCDYCEGIYYIEKML